MIRMPGIETITQGAQYHLIKDYGLNYIRNPGMIWGLFLDEAVLGSLGRVANKAVLRREPGVMKKTCITYFLPGNS